MWGFAFHGVAEIKLTFWHPNGRPHQHQGKGKTGELHADPTRTPSVRLASVCKHWTTYCCLILLHQAWRVMCDELSAQ